MSSSSQAYPSPATEAPAAIKRLEEALTKPYDEVGHDSTRGPFCEVLEADLRYLLSALAPSPDEAAEEAILPAAKALARAAWQQARQTQGGRGRMSEIDRLATTLAAEWARSDHFDDPWTNMARAILEDLREPSEPLAWELNVPTIQKYIEHFLNETEGKDDT